MRIVGQDRTEIFNFDRIKKIWIDGNVLNNVLYKTYTEFEICADGEILGYYKTEERAKKVLEEITDMYCSCNSEYGNIGYVKNRVYKMPKE